MSKHETFREYPPRGLANAEAALLTIWPTLNLYHEDLVLVGGLAVHYLTNLVDGWWPGAVTLDVDLGIALAAGGGMYGTIRTELGGLGFQADVGNPSRLVKRVDEMNLYIDFLTERDGATTGSAMVDDVTASLAPGIARALGCRTEKQIAGKDLYGADQVVALYVADIGPLLVLKLNAFGGPHGRRHPKDAYDVLLAVSAFIDGPEEAVRRFRAEADCGNPAYATAVRTLENDFRESTADGPVRAAEFLRGTRDETQRIREHLVTIGRALLGE